MLPSAGLWLNASKSESMLESDETSSPQTEMRTHSPLLGDDRITEPRDVWRNLDTRLC